MDLITKKEAIAIIKDRRDNIKIWGDNQTFDCVINIELTDNTHIHLDDYSEEITFDCRKIKALEYLGPDTQCKYGELN